MSRIKSFVVLCRFTPHPVNTWTWAVWPPTPQQQRATSSPAAAATTAASGAASGASGKKVRIRNQSPSVVHLHAQPEIVMRIAHFCER